MPRIPTYEDQARPIQQVSRSVPQEQPYGAIEARGDAALAGAFTDAGKVFLQLQEQQDRVDADNAYNELLKKQSEMAYGEDGFLKRKGRDAVHGNLLKEYTERYGSKRDDISNTLLSTPRAKEYFRQRADIASKQFTNDMLKHIATESDAYAKEVLGQRLILNQRTAAEKNNAENDVRTAILDSQAMLKAEAARSGWPKDKRDNAIAEATSDMHIAAIEGAVNDKNPAHAQYLFDKYKERKQGDPLTGIDKTKWEKIEKLIKAADLTEFGQSFVENAVAQGWDERTALKEAKKLDGEQEEITKKAVKAHFQETRIAANEAAGMKYDEAIRAGKTPAEALALVQGAEGGQLWKDMSASARKALTDAPKVDKPADGSPQYHMLINLAEQYPKKFREIAKETDGFQIFKQLTDNNRKQLQKMAADSSAMKAHMTESEIKKGFLSVYGVEGAKSGEDNYMDAMNKMEDALQDWAKAHNKDRQDLSTYDMQEALVANSIEVIRKGNWPITWATDYPAGQMALEDKPTVGFGEEGTAGRFDIPRRLIPVLAYRLRNDPSLLASEKEVNEENLLREYRRWIGDATNPATPYYRSR